MNVTRIYGGIFTCPEAGVAQSITAQIECTVGVANIKAALYTYPERTLVATTEEIVNFSGSVSWVTFNFPSPKPALTNRQYIIVIWGNSSNADVCFQDSVVNAKSGYTSPMAYGSWPSYLDGSYSERAQREVCIYCTYEVVVTPTHLLRIDSTPISVPVTLNSQVQGNTPISVNAQEGTYVVVVPSEGEG